MSSLAAAERITFDADSVTAAIEKAEPGIRQYLEIMAEFPRVNVAEDREFQRKFNGFYRVRQRPAEWYAAYYGCMEECKHLRPVPTFDEILDHLWLVLARCEASFASKLAATLDPSRPIWDRYVLANLGIRPVTGTGATKVAASKTAYATICAWYGRLLRSDEGAGMVRLFDTRVPEYRWISDVKKVDFVLWQMRGVTGPDILHSPRSPYSMYYTSNHIN